MGQNNSLFLTVYYKQVRNSLHESGYLKYPPHPLDYEVRHLAAKNSPATKRAQLYNWYIKLHLQDVAKDVQSPHWGESKTHHHNNQNNSNKCKHHPVNHPRCRKRTCRLSVHCEVHLQWAAQ